MASILQARPSRPGLVFVGEGDGNCASDIEVGSAVQCWFRFMSRIVANLCDNPRFASHAVSIAIAK